MGRKTDQRTADRLEIRQNKSWNEVEKVILERRSVRKYKKKQVPENLVRRILEAGRYAPSAGNYQPWGFIVIRDKEILDEMEAFIRKQCKIAKFLLDWQTSRLGLVAWGLARTVTRLMPNKMHPTPFTAVFLIADGKLKAFHDAPTVILLLKDRRGVSKPDVDIGICGQNIVLAAHSLGLGTCWVGFVELIKHSPKWNKRLGIEYPYELSEGIVVGYPVGHPDGIVPREIHQIGWVEGGTRKIVS
jgi:nitroreductase